MLGRVIRHTSNSPYCWLLDQKIAYILAKMALKCQYLTWYIAYFSEQFWELFANVWCKWLTWNMANCSHTPLTLVHRLLWSQSYPQCYMTLQSCTWHRQTNNLFITYWCLHGNAHPMLLIQAQSWLSQWLVKLVICGTVWIKVALWLARIVSGSPNGWRENIPALTRQTADPTS